jgi:hypothetical protein
MSTMQVVVENKRLRRARAYECLKPRLNVRFNAYFVTMPSILGFPCVDRCNQPIQNWIGEIPLYIQGAMYWLHPAALVEIF